MKARMPRQISFDDRDTRLGQLSRCVSIEMTTATTTMVMMTMMTITMIMTMDVVSPG